MPNGTFNRSDQGRESADEIHPNRVGGTIQASGQVNVGIGVRAFPDQRDGRDGNASIDDRDTIFPFERIPGADQVLRVAADLLVSALAGACKGAVQAIPQADAHGNGANVQVLHLDHLEGLENLVRRELHIAHPCIRPGA
jgi:hypothetical protein